MGFFDIEVSHDVAIMNAGNAGIHNFCLGTLDTYFYVNEAKQAQWLGDQVFVAQSPQGRYKTWIFNADKPIQKYFYEIKHLQSLGPVYSQKLVDLPASSKFQEVVYDLNEVFDLTMYADARKRHKRLIYPPRWFDKQGYKLVLLANEHKAQIEVLHDAWVQHKLDQPTTFKMMFPAARYKRCAFIALKNPDKYISYGAFKDDNLVGVRILYLEKNIAFDLAHFTASWNQPSNFSESFAMMTMIDLKNYSISKINCGASLNKSLSTFKHHWPSANVLSWAYAKRS
jgi:hypothetical protein